MAKRYCKLDKKGMGFQFDGCPCPDTLCFECANNIPDGEEIDTGTLNDAINELRTIAQAVLNNIEDAAVEYADSKLPDSPYSQNTMRKQLLYEWSDLADAFKAGVRWVANKHNITF
jgi:hypothetical protein